LIKTDSESSSKLSPPFVEITLIKIRGSAPQEVGARIFVGPQGRLDGTIGGGKIEAHAIKWAQEILKKGSGPEDQTWNLQKDIGMSCGGEVTLFFRPTQVSNWKVHIFGAGHISQALCRLLSPLDCALTVYDSRQEWLDLLPVSWNLKTQLIKDYSEEFPLISDQSFVVSMTMGHSTDLPVLKSILKKHQNLPFVGVIGSDVKGRKLKAELAMELPSHLVESLHCPVGLPFGNNTPEEIALSVAAHLLTVRDKGSQG
jgi:xanthine dehydrogenase accessory factor